MVSVLKNKSIFYSGKCFISAVIKKIIIKNKVPIDIDKWKQRKMVIKKKMGKQTAKWAT